MKKISLLIYSVKLVWKSSPGWTLANIFISLFRSFIPLIFLYLIKVLIDEITAGVSQGNDEMFASVIRIAVAVVLVYFADEISSEAASYIRTRQSFRLEDYMYRLLHSKATTLDLINFENPVYFDKLSRAASEATWRPNNILNNFVALFRGIISLLLMAGLLFTLNWWIALLLIIINIPGIWLRLHFSSILFNFRKEMTPEERKSEYFNWLLIGDRPSREIRLFGLGDYFIFLFRKSFSTHKKEESKIIKRRTIIDAFTGIFKAAILFIVLYVITRQTFDGKITLGGMAMMILAFRQGLVSIRDIMGSVAGLYEDSLFTGNIYEFLNLKEKILPHEPVTAVTPFQKEIRLEHVNFRYPDNYTPALEDINLTLSKGEVVALVGPNGSGKSTLVRILCRLYDPDSGSVLYDGKDIKNFVPEEYRKQFSVLFQDFMLYNLTAGENIRLGNVAKASDVGKIKEAASEAGIHSLIESLPQGYETSIGPLFNEGRELSWGEWQKIALARTLYRDAPILVLDEPSSALDADSEYEIFTRFREAVKGKTVLLISHRFTCIRLADRIIVLNKGKIAESGTHDELMQVKGIYYNLYLRQKSMYRDEKQT